MYDRASMALPTFMDSIRKSRRTDAFNAIANVQQLQERWRSNRNAYAASLNNAADPALFDMRDYAAKYFLFNGKAYPQTDPIVADMGPKVLLRYVNAGHNPPFLHSPQKGKPVDRLFRTGMALGILKEASWTQKIVKHLLRLSRGSTPSSARDSTGSSMEWPVITVGA